MTKKLPKPKPIEPWKPPEWQKADAQAVKALARGDATPEQQRRALDWIIREACATYEFAFHPGADDRETNLALGRQMVGQQIVKLINLDLQRIGQANQASENS